MKTVNFPAQKIKKPYIYKVCVHKFTIFLACLISKEYHFMPCSLRRLNNPHPAKHTTKPQTPSISCYCEHLSTSFTLLKQKSSLVKNWFKNINSHPVTTWDWIKANAQWHVLPPTPFPAITLGSAHRAHFLYPPLLQTIAKSTSGKFLIFPLQTWEGRSQKLNRRQQMITQKCHTHHTWKQRNTTEGQNGMMVKPFQPLKSRLPKGHTI